MTSKPTIVTLCGSTRFKDEYIYATREETLKFRIVISVGLFGHQEGLDMSSETKKKLDELHLRKIDLADEVLVIDAKTTCCNHCKKPIQLYGKNAKECCNRLEWFITNYIGESTSSEIEYARSRGKKVRYWSKEQLYAEYTK